MKRKFLMAAMCFVMAGTLCEPGNVMAEETATQSVATTENVDVDGTEDGYVVPELKEWEYSLGTNKISRSCCHSPDFPAGKSVS